MDGLFGGGGPPPTMVPAGQASDATTDVAVGDVFGLGLPVPGPAASTPADDSLAVADVAPSPRADLPTKTEDANLQEAPDAVGKHAWVWGASPLEMTNDAQASWKSGTFAAGALKSPCTSSGPRA